MELRALPVQYSSVTCDPTHASGICSPAIWPPALSPLSPVTAHHTLGPGPRAFLGAVKRRQARYKALVSGPTCLCLECGASLLRLLPYPQGLLGAPLVASDFDRAVLEESVLIYPAALVVGRDHMVHHLYA